MIQRSHLCHKGTSMSTLRASLLSCTFGAKPSAAAPQGLHIGALIIGIGFGGISYYNLNKETPNQKSIGNYLGSLYWSLRSGGPKFCGFRAWGRFWEPAKGSEKAALARATIPLTSFHYNPCDIIRGLAAPLLGMDVDFAPNPNHPYS